MNEAIYFAAGYYHPVKIAKNKKGELCKILLTNQPRQFELVGQRRGNGDLPYLTHNRNGLKLTSHHANLYGLLSDGETSMMIEYRCPKAAMPVPAEDGFLYENPVKLSGAHIAAIKKAIEANYFFD